MGVRTQSPPKPYTQHWRYLREDKWRRLPEQLFLACTVGVGPSLTLVHPSEFDKRVLINDWSIQKPLWEKKLTLKLDNAWRNRTAGGKTEEKKTVPGVRIFHVDVSYDTSKTPPVAYANVGLVPEGDSETRKFALSCRLLLGGTLKTGSTVRDIGPLTSDKIDYRLMLLGNVMKDTVYTAECIADPDGVLSDDPDRSNNTKTLTDVTASK